MVISCLSRFGPWSDLNLVVDGLSGPFGSVWVFSGLWNRTHFYFQRLSLFGSQTVFLGRWWSFVLVSIWSFKVVTKLFRPYKNQNHYMEMKTKKNST